MSISPQQRFTRSHPCPICGGYDSGNLRGKGVRCWGYLSDNGEFCFCTREEHAGTLTPQGHTEAYMHRLSGPCSCGLEHGIRIAPIKAERPRKHRDFEKPEGELDCYHVYFDETGKPVHRTARYKNPKTFRQQRYCRGAWRWGLKDTRLVLYRLPQLLKSHPSVPVWLCEGESDADRLASLGCAATTNVHGAGAWLPYYGDWLRGRDIVILQDNDEQGAKRTRTLINELGDVARRIRVLAFPELKPGGDVRDFLELHPDYDRVDLIGRAKEVQMERSA